MKHHTKDKGDKGVGFVVADLLKHGIQPAFLLSEHLPFDCIAISHDMRLSRISVKYRSAKDEKIEVSLTSSWADRSGVHTKHHNKKLFDAVAVYCPDTGEVYYVKTSEFSENVDAFTLRLSKPKNGQKAGVRMACDHLGPTRLFV